jgi:protein phosphatase
VTARLRAYVKLSQNPLSDFPGLSVVAPIRKQHGLAVLAKCGDGSSAAQLRCITTPPSLVREKSSINDLKLAPFHLLASEGGVHTDKRHTWHMEMLDRLCAADEQLLLRTPFQIVDLNDAARCDTATLWWKDMTSAGREGMVVKPLDFIARGGRGIAQPAIKCRGPEYLRIIYGPEYLLPENLERLRARNVGAKRSLASREFAVGIEALERFVRKEPLRRVHECAFGVLALESESVDPRL